MNTNSIENHDSTVVKREGASQSVSENLQQDTVVVPTTSPAHVLANTENSLPLAAQLSQKNVLELRQLAKELHVPRYSRLNKAELIHALLQQSAERLQGRLTTGTPNSHNSTKTFSGSFLRRVATQLNRFGWKRTLATAVVIVGTPIGLVSDSTTIISNLKLLLEPASPSSVSPNPNNPATQEANKVPALTLADIASSPSVPIPDHRPAMTSLVEFPSALNIGLATTVLIEQPVGRPEWINALELDMITRESGPLDEVDKKKVAEFRKTAEYTGVFKNCCLISNEFETATGAQVELTASSAYCAAWATSVNLDTHQKHVLTNTAIFHDSDRTEPILLGSLPTAGRYVVLLYLFPLDNTSVTQLGLDTIAETDNLTLAINTPATLIVHPPQE